MDATSSTNHINEYSRLWNLLNNIHLKEEIEDTIVWNLRESGEYLSASAYHSHFFGATDTHMNKLVWKEPMGLLKDLLKMLSSARR
jgi:hypothetical protein